MTKVLALGISANIECGMLDGVPKVIDGYERALSTCQSEVGKSRADWHFVLAYTRGAGWRFEVAASDQSCSGS